MGIKVKLKVLTVLLIMSLSNLALAQNVEGQASYQNETYSTQLAKILPTKPIKLGSSVSFHYELWSSGKIYDSTFGGEPVNYIAGNDEIISGLEEFMYGKRSGFEGVIEVPAQKAYGLYNSDLVVYANYESFDDSVEIKIGETVEVDGDDGVTYVFRIIELDKEKVYLDGNHPLAGKDLKYRIKVLKVD